jgi:hypothetical protein
MFLSFSGSTIYRIYHFLKQIHYLLLKMPPIKANLKEDMLTFTVLGSGEFPK